MPGLPYVKGRRLRIFGGPNGSGKTTIIELIQSSFDVGYYINADDIEKEIKSTGEFDIQRFGIHPIAEKEFDSFLKGHGINAKAKARGYNLNLKIDGGKILVSNPIQLSYEAALIAEYLRQELLKAGKKMTFETVMSHPSKVDIIEEANRNGYKTYLYFICTSTPEINLERVNLRVKRVGTLSIKT